MPRIFVAADWLERKRNVYKHIYATPCSIYIPGLPESADKEAVRNLFSGLFEAQR